jgi:RalA-binding protein 1
MPSPIFANLPSFCVVLIRSFIPSDLEDPQERITELSHLIAILPVANYSLLRALTAHLISVVQNSNVNKMTMRNVMIVFSPTLGIPAGVFRLMLTEFNRVFNVDDAYEAELAAITSL